MKNIETYKRWLSFLSDVKSFMIACDYKEVITQTLVKSPAMEAYLEAYKIEGEERYLPTSPEFGLKKIWLSGDREFSRIFELARSFRAKEEQSPYHLSEFTMLEFYNDSLSFDEFINEVSNLCKKFLNLSSDFKPSYVSLPDTFFALTGLELHPNFTEIDFQSLCKRLRVGFSESDSINDLFQRLYLEFIEPSVSKKDFIIMKDFPPFLSALSTISKSGWAERFEFYFGGLELANGYNELLDPILVQKRWRKENQVRVMMGEREYPLDQDFLKLLEIRNINQGVGVALGLERLFYIKEKLKGRAIKLEDTQV